MALYLYNCETHGDITLEHSMLEAGTKKYCSICKSELKRIFSPTNSIWKTSGAYGKSSS